MEKININQFFEEFEVKRNPVEMFSPFENRLLDMDEKELDHLEELDVHNTWTLIDDDNNMKLIPGRHYNNVMGYFISGKKWADENKKFVVQ